MNKKKTIFWIEIVSGLLLSIILTLLFPSSIGDEIVVDGVKFSSEDSMIAQRITSVSFTPQKITKLYLGDSLLGVLQDESRIDEIINIVYREKYADKFEGCTLNLDSSIYTVSENCFWQYEDKDDEIIDYLYRNELFEIEAYRIEIDNTNEYADEACYGKYTIYVLNEEDFTTALKRFALRFISEETYNILDQGEEIADPTEYGIQEQSIELISTITCQKSSASYDEIMVDSEAIYQFLCYGYDTEPEYYTIVEYDSISGVATKNGLTPDLLVALNDNLTSTKQSLIVGEQLNVRKFESPLTFLVKKLNYEKVITLPGADQYVKDETLTEEEVVLTIEAHNGYDDVYTTELYVNGEIYYYVRDEERTHTVIEAQANVYHYNRENAMSGRTIILPVENPIITCVYGDSCYYHHHGTDFINRYDRYGKIMAVCDGVVTKVGYADDMGNYCYIDIGDGYVVRYLHMYTSPMVDVGDQVVCGQQIGNIGSTGNSTGPHVDIGVLYKGAYTDPCDLLPCSVVTTW